MQESCDILEADIVLEMQNGSPEAFEAIHGQYRPMVYAIALKQCRNPEDAENITQQVFAIVFRKKGQLRDAERFAGWLKRIVLRTAMNYLIRRSEEIPAEELEHSVQANVMSPSISVMQQERAEHIRRLLQSGLRPLDRETLTAFYFEHLSVREMAERFACPVGTIKRRLHIARLRFGEVLLLAGIDSTEL